MRVETIGRATLYLGDCRDVLPTLGKVDAVVTDPPYFQVKGDYWDNEWDNPKLFIEWMGDVVAMLNDRLPPSGSLYLFASPQMAARVEIAIRERMNVLAMITWNKGARRKGAAGSGVDVTSLRTFWQASSERIIFAEPYGSDAYADGEAGYTSACEATKRAIFGDYLAAEFEGAGVTRKQIAALFPSATGGLTGCVSNWIMGYNVPTAEQYAVMRAFLNGDHLRREYEDLRRPFFLNNQLQWGDVWDFDPPPPTSGKHPCEKPLPLLQHIIQVSTKPNQVVLDAFMGSGATGDAALCMGRDFIGIERDPHWFAVACRRIEQAQRQGDMFIGNAA
ncbi:MAG: DNA-methyltransferase [Sphingomonas sp.]